MSNFSSLPIVSCAKLNMYLNNGKLVESRKRSWEYVRNATRAFPSPKRPLSDFSVAPWSGVLGAFREDKKYANWNQFAAFAMHPGRFDVDPFIPINEEQNPITQDVWLNTCHPLGQSTIWGDGRLMFQYRGIDVLRRIPRDDPYDTVEHSVDGKVFVNGYFMREDDHALRQEVLKDLSQDYQAAHKEFVKCITFADLKSHIGAYVMRVRQLRQSVVASEAEQFHYSDYQKTIYKWSRPTTVNGGSQAAAGVEALLGLCMGPQDLFDLFRPIGICFTGKNKIDADSDLVTLLSGGCGKMKISSMDDTLCKRDESGPFTLWLVYLQKKAKVVESGNGHLDNYPDLDLVITNKSENAFLQAYMANVEMASYSSKNDPREITPFYFLPVAVIRSGYPCLNDDTEVFMTLAERCEPIVLTPSRVRSR